ncbi:M15 family metallopeptidase [Cellulomonas soli]|nr:M15 family metallopeptidase [Cellulomonas soli]NYI59544.1 D-alanyl-D-alanine dipeptidase [Cellulomonas soli]
MDAIAAISQRMYEIRSMVEGSSTLASTTTSAASATAGTALTSSGTSSSSSASFASALAQAVTGGSATRLNGDGVPVELAAYGNGQIPASALAQVGTTGHRLWAPAAEKLTQLISDAAADGVTVGITDSYRSYDAQVDLAERKGLYKNGGLAAVPGTSDHGWGMAVDLSLDDKAQVWMREHGDEYGFVEDTPREPWHWGYHG